MWVLLPLSCRSYSPIPPRSYPKSRCAPSTVNENLSAISSKTLSVGWSLVRRRFESKFFVKSSRRSAAWRSPSFAGLICRCKARRCSRASEISVRGTGRYTVMALSSRNTTAEMRHCRTQESEAHRRVGDTQSNTLLFERARRMVHHLAALLTQALVPAMTFLASLPSLGGICKEEQKFQMRAQGIIVCAG